MAATPTTASLALLPSPTDITLLFKHHKSTTLLSVSPTQSFGEIKALLLLALRSRNLTIFPNPTTSLPLPKDPEDLEFGVLADRKDASKGWVKMEIGEADLSDSKGGKRKVGGKKSALNASPLGAGLVDGSWVAYRLKPQSGAAVAAKEEDEDDSDMADINVDEMVDPGWDVVLPSFEEEVGGE